MTGQAELAIGAESTVLALVTRRFKSGDYRVLGCHMSGQTGLVWRVEAAMLTLETCLG